MGQNRKQRRIIAKKNKGSTASISKEYIQEKANLLRLLDNQANIYYQQERFADAENIFRQCLEISKKIFELDHPVLCVVALTNLASVLTELDKYAEAESLCRIGLDKLEKILADNSFSYTRKLNDLAVSLCDNLINVLYHFARHAEAEPLCHRVLEFHEQGISLKSIEVVKLLNNMAKPLFENCRYATAESLYRRSFEILKKEYGSDHPDAAMILHNWALVLFNLGRYAEAEPLFCQALEIMENAKNPEQSQLALCLNNIANLMGKLGRYIEAERHHRRALHIRKSILEPEHNDVAVSLSNLALQLYNLGRYAEAEPFYRQALEIQKKLENSDLSGTLNNFALLLCKLGRHTEAEHLQRHAFEIDSNNVYGPDHPYVAGSLNNLTKYLSPFEAEPLLSCVLEMREKKLGPNHPDVAASLNNLALIYCHLNRYEEAELNHQRALEIEENFYGKEHTEVSVTLHNLAKLLHSINRSAEAEQLYYRSLAILEKNYGTKHHFVAISLKSLAVLFEATDRLPSAILLAKRATNIMQGSRQDVSALGEKALDSFDKTIEHYYGFTTQTLIKAKRYGEAEFVMAMLKEKEQFELWRGNQHEDLSILQISYNDAETPLIERFDALSSSLYAFGQQQNMLNKIEKPTLEQEQELADVKQHIEQLDQDFNLFLGTLHDALPPQQVNRVQQDAYRFIGLSNAIPGTAVITTVTAEDSFHTILATPDGCTTFSAEQRAEDIAKKVLHFRELLKDLKSDEYKLVAQELYNIIIRPMEQEFQAGNISTLYWMLDGSLRLLPLAALHDGEEFLLQKEFRTVSITTNSKIGAMPHDQWNGLGMGVTKEHDGHPKLAAVKEELENIIAKDNTNGIIPGDILLDEQFTRETMEKRLQEGYKAVHIASHFELSPVNETLSYLLLGDGTHFKMDEIRSHKDLFKGVDILAFSACETGKGTLGTRGREVDGIGYLGEMQGAKTVLATLWPVEDKSTSVLMREFYTLREEGMTKAEALRQAQLALLNGMFTSEDGHDFTHPYFWAPFILIGNGG